MSTLPSTEPTTEPVSTTEPTTISTAEPITTVPINYCQVADSPNHHLTISFVLCIDYIYLLSYEKADVKKKLSNFMNISTKTIHMYRLVVPDEKRIYNNIRSPPALTCSSRTKLDHGLADSGGWKSFYNGYQTSVDVYFSCEQAKTVLELVEKIKLEISLNKLQDHVGFHVIGWVLYRWYCEKPTTAPLTT